jgi:hypothetical protein
MKVKGGLFGGGETAGSKKARGECDGDSKFNQSTLYAFIKISK